MIGSIVLADHWSKGILHIEKNTREFRRTWLLLHISTCCHAQDYADEATVTVSAPPTWSHQCLWCHPAFNRRVGEFLQDNYHLYQDQAIKLIPSWRFSPTPIHTYPLPNITHPWHDLLLPSTISSAPTIIMNNSRHFKSFWCKLCFYDTSNITNKKKTHQEH